MLLLLLAFDTKEEELKICFGVENHTINANTLSNSLISISDTIQLIDSFLNPGFDIEIVVEAIGPGSFKLDIKKRFYSIRANIFNADNFKNFAIGIFTSLVWELVHPDRPINVITNENEYILERGDERLVLPKDVEKYYDSLKRNDAVLKNMEKTFQIIKADLKINYLELYPNVDKSKGNVYVDRRYFDSFIVPESDSDTKEEIFKTRLIIIRAVLEKGNRRWQFSWNGIKISAPIKDEEFFYNFSAHQITIAPGDYLEVELKIIKEKDEESNLYFNKEYEVLKVIKHFSNREQLPELGF